MRARSETIYALHEKEYLELMEEIETQKGKRQNAKRDKSMYFNEDQSLSSNVPEDDLSYGKPYELSFIQPSLQQREEEDELELLKSIDNLNKKNKKEKNQNDLSQRNRMMSEDLTKKAVQNNSLTKNLIINNGVNQNDEENLLKLAMHKSNSHKSLISVDTLYDKDNILHRNEFSPLENNRSTKPDSMALENNNSHSESFLNQNLINFEEVLKLIVIGDKGVGKSLLVNRLISEKNSNLNYASSCYIPTECLEIKKVFHKINDIQTKIELWDTNLSIQNSLIIKTYYKICHGFILVSDYDRIESFAFVEKQLENIFNYSNNHNNILFLINKRTESENLSTPDHIKSYFAIDSKIEMISNKFNITPVFCNLSEFSRTEKSTRLFLKQVLTSKSGGAKKKTQKISMNKKDSSNFFKSSAVDNNINFNDILSEHYSKPRRKKSDIFGELYK